MKSKSNSRTVPGFEIIFGWKNVSATATLRSTYWLPIGMIPGRAEWERSVEGDFTRLGEDTLELNGPIGGLLGYLR